MSADYLTMNDLLHRARFGPFNAAYRASKAQRKVMFYDPRNNPSRMQFAQQYTIPYQVFAASNSWNTPSGRESVSKPATQPSTKLPGPGLTAVPVLSPF